MTTDMSALEVQTLREEAILAVARAVTDWCRHRKAMGAARPTEAQLMVESKLERSLCETARALAAWDDAYGKCLDAEVALTTHDGSNTVN